MQYMVNLMAYKIVIDMKNENEDISELEYALGVLQGFALLSAPILMMLFIRKNRKKI